MDVEDTSKEKAVHAIPHPRASDRPVDASVAALFETHHDRVYRVARRITGSPEDAEDVVQTVFLRVVRRDDPPPHEDHAAPYFHRAAVNASLDLLRRRKVAHVEPLDRTDAYEDHAPSPEALSEGARVRERLRLALADLSPRAAEIFVLRYFDGYGNREIARLLNTSWSTVAVTLHRTRAKLQQSLKGELR